MKRNIQWLTLAVAVVFATITLRAAEDLPREVDPPLNDIGATVESEPDEQPAVGPLQESPVPDEQLFQEIRNLRKEVGGSVLAGSLLEIQDPVQADKAFDVGARKAIGLPATNEAESSSATESPQSNQQIVAMLREHSTRLDQVANQIELLREYNNADQLRDTATAMRMLARRFDRVAK